MRRPRPIPFLCLLVLTLLFSGCRSTQAPSGEQSLPQWNLAGARFLQWKADDEDFDQDHAIEASGMAADGEILWIASEKFAHLLKLNSRTLEARVEAVDLPPFSELEGITVDQKHGMLITDEAHADIFVLRGGSQPRSIDLTALGIHGGKEGIEGIASTNDGRDRVFLLQERSRVSKAQCASTVFPLRWEGDQLIADGPKLISPMEDCNWRLTALEYYRGKLLGLKTRFPGPRYQLVMINSRNGELTQLLDLDALIDKAEAEGWHGNIEGFAITADETLWIVSDNAMTKNRGLEAPPMSRRKTLLLRIPAYPTAAEGGRR